MVASALMSRPDTGVWGGKARAPCTNAWCSVMLASDCAEGVKAKGRLGLLEDGKGVPAGTLLPHAELPGIGTMAVAAALVVVYRAGVQAAAALLGVLWLLLALLLVLS